MMSEKSNQSVRVRQGATERADGGPTRTPYVDIYETADGLTVVAEMPGVDRDSVRVEVEKGVLTISGRPEPMNVEGYRPIYEGLDNGGDFFRAFALSDEVDREKTTASLRDGVLTVVLPKAAQARTVQIPVQAGP